jgi:hypothetical protein
VDRARDVVLLELTKSGRRREVPLNGPADAVLARLGGGEGLVLAGVRFHDLRHTFASWAMQRGATLPELQGPLGHSSTATVLRYAHLARSTCVRLSPGLTIRWRRLRRAQRKHRTSATLQRNGGQHLRKRRVKW